jgi:hypothetical protein
MLGPGNVLALLAGQEVERSVSHVNQESGILTRTAQSSLALALLRCIITDGDIFLDGVETKSVNLDVLRSNITIIPQVVSDVLQPC